MVSADYWVVGGACVFAVLGAALGFGRGLKMLSKGVLGKIAAVVFAYYLFGIVLTLDVTKTAQTNFITFLEGKDNWFCRFLITIRIETILTGVVVFLLSMLLISLVVNILAGILDGEGGVLKGLNCILGVVLALAEFIALVLLILLILKLISGTNTDIADSLQGSFFRLDKIYDDNPLSAFIRVYIPEVAGFNGN